MEGFCRFCTRSGIFTIGDARSASSINPIHIEMINTAGMTILLPILAMSGAGQVGATLALWIRCRKINHLLPLLKGLFLSEY